MSMWLWIVIGAHLLNALSFVVNKFILGHIKVQTAGYAGLIGWASIFATVLMPWGFAPLSFVNAIIALVTGAVFIWALYFFFSALQRNEVSTIVPVIGGAIPAITLVLAAVLIHERLPKMDYVAFAVLLVGTLFMLWNTGKGKNRAVSNASLAIALGAAVLFALSSVGMKYIFNQTEFINGFIWTRWGSVLGAAVFLISPAQTRYMKDAFRILFSRSGLLFGLGESIGAGGFIVLTYTMSLASPTLINALQGVQYALLLMVAIIGWMVKPDMLGESFTKREILLKIFGIILIGGGVWMIAIV